MAKETFTGPLIALGGFAGGPGGAQPREYSDEIGPSIFWAGIAIPASGGSKDRTGPGTIPSVYAAFPVRTVNCAMAAGNAPITVAANAVAGVALPNLATYAAGRAIAVPVLTSGGIAATGVGLDMGLDTVTFGGAGVVTLSVPANTWRYRVGQWVGVLNGVVTSGATLMSQITAIGVGTLTLSPAAQASGTGQIALTNRYNPNAYGLGGTAPSSLSSLAAAGTARIHIPEVGTTRGIGITGVASGTGGIFDIVGIGAFGALMTEQITATAGATTVWGKKTYDIFISATPRFSDAHNYTVVTSDFFGMPMSVMSADNFATATFAGAALVFSGTTTATVIPADTTYPATSTTGDPRGGLQLTANGPGATPSGTLVTINGTNVMVIDQRLSPLQVALATTINPGPIVGVPSV